MRLIGLQEIQKSLNIQKVISLQEEGFKLYSAGKVTVPPVGHIALGQQSDAHIKYGWIQGDEIFAVKVAGAFPNNPQQHHLSVIQGIILVFDATTGQTRAILQDEGFLTNYRTAIAGLIVAKNLAPKKVEAIGILGTGTQARLQAKLLMEYTSCRHLWVWGRNQKKVLQYIHDMKKTGFEAFEAASPKDICKHCNLIVTTTSSNEPLIHAQDVKQGTHITAVGADAPGKQELDPFIFQRADLVVVDSKTQCLDHGEAAHPYKMGILKEKNLVELGDVIAKTHHQRQSEQQITIADLTGVGVQDIQIAKAVLSNDRK